VDSRSGTREGESGLTGIMKLNEAGKIVIVPDKPKPPESVTLLRDRELESIKRTLANAIDKIEKIQRREAELITT